MGGGGVRTGGPAGGIRALTPLGRFRRRRRAEIPYFLVSRELWPFHQGGGLGRSVNSLARLLRRAGPVTIVTSDIHRAAYERMRAAHDPRLPSGAEIRLLREPLEHEARAAHSRWHVWSERVSDELRSVVDGQPAVIEFPDYLAEGAAAIQARREGDPALAQAVCCLRLRGSHELIRTLDGSSAESDVQAVEQLERRALGTADLLLAPAAQVARDYVSFYGADALAPTRVIAPSVPVAVSGSVGTVPPLEPLRLLYVGRLQRVKGVENLVRAFRELPAQDVRLTLVGGDTATGPGGSSMRAHLESLAAGDRRVEVAGLLPPAAVESLLAQSHLVVAPSLWDCWSHAVREALRANRPVVVTSVGGLSELASDADAGWGLPDTSVEALARRLRDLSEGREEVGRLIDSGAPLRALQRSVDEDRVLAEYRGLAEIAGGEGHGAAPAAASRAASI